MNTVCNTVPMNKIRSTDNSRVKVDVSELMSSIKQHGLLQPIGVTKKGTGFSVAYGNRRFAAAKKLKMSSIPCVVLSKAQGENEEILTLVENLQRENPNVFETGRYMQRLADDGYSMTEIASLVNKPKSFVRACLDTVARVPTEFKKHVIEAKSGSKASGIPLSVVGMIESNHRAIPKTKKSDIYRLAKSDDMPATTINDICKIVADGSSVKQALKTVKSHESLSFRLNINKNDLKKLNKYVDKEGSYSNVIRKILGGQIKETIRTM